MMTTYDVTTIYDGSVWLLRPNTDKGREWLLENLPDEARFGRNYWAESPFVRDIVIGMVEDGLAVE